MTNATNYKIWLISILESLILFFSPIYAIVFLVGFIALLDTFFGVWASIKNNTFTSRKLRIGFMPKVFGYTIAILVVYAVDFHILNPLVSHFLSIQFLSTKVTSLVFVIIETKSIDENFKRIYGYSIVKKANDIVRGLKTVKDQIKD